MDTLPKKVSINFIAAVAAAVAVGLISAMTFRSEIVDRLGASGMDYVLVALFSSLAGTYAFYSPKDHEAVAGIAISVAVIPPIVMLGIGLGIGIAKQDNNLMYVSGTIVLGNVIGIYIGSVVMVALLHRIQGIELRARDARRGACPPQQSVSLCRAAYGNPRDVETNVRQAGNAEGARGNL